jgi:hypothetical protein
MSDSITATPESNELLDSIKPTLAVGPIATCAAYPDATLGARGQLTIGSSLSAGGRRTPRPIAGTRPRLWSPRNGAIIGL